MEKVAVNRFVKRQIKGSGKTYSESLTFDEHLSKSKFLAGDNYSIADIATFPWIARHNWHDVGLKNFKNLCRWYEIISAREAVIKGYDCLETGETIPKI